MSKGIKKDKNRIGRILLLFVSFYCAIVALLYFQQRNLIFFPDTNEPSIEPKIVVKTEDGLFLKGLYVPAKEKDFPVIVFFHGNAGHYGHRAFKAVKYIEKGYGVLIAGYRGYGGNPGKPSEEGLYKDARAYISYLFEEERIQPNQIVLYGESLGTGVAVQMAMENKVKALVLETPYDSMLHVAKHYYPYVLFLDYLIKDPFRNDLKAKQILASKVLFLIAGKDEVIPTENAMRLYNLIEQDKVLHIFKDAGHNTIYNFSPDKVVFTFLR